MAQAKWAQESRRLRNLSIFMRMAIGLYNPKQLRSLPVRHLDLHAALKPKIQSAASCMAQWTSSLRHSSNCGAAEQYKFTTSTDPCNMTALPDLRCVMKIRTCGPFWHKAAVSLSYPTTDKAHQGLLTIDRPKATGGSLEIPLGRCDRMPTLVFASEKDQRRRQFTVCYGVWRRCVTLRVATDAIYRAWWAALETAYMSLYLKQISRPLVTNFNEEGPEEVPKMDAVVNNLPILEVSSPTSAVETGSRDGWRFDEDPDELVVVGSAARLHDDPPGKLKIDAVPVVGGPKDEPSSSSGGLSSREAVLGATASYSHSTHSDRDGASSCIGSDVLDYLPGDLRDIMENYSSESVSSYSTSSSLASIVRDHLPSDVLDLLDSCPVPTYEVQANNQNRGFDLYDGGHNLPRRGENLCHHGYPLESKSAKLSNGGSDASVRESLAQTEDTTTVSAVTSSTSRDALDDALSAIGAGEITTDDSLVLPGGSVSTPFERLLLRQQWRAKVNARRTVDGDTSRSPGTYGDSNSELDWTSSPRPHPADSERPKSLTIGRIDKARVEEIEEFASRRVSGSARASKKAIVVKRITKAWTDVARSAFRPDGDNQTTNRATKMQRHRPTFNHLHASTGHTQN